MKKTLMWLLMVAIVLLPVMGMAETILPEWLAVIDWTNLIVWVIGAVALVLSILLCRVWVHYIKPWLDQRGLTDAARIVVEAVEAIFGRYCGQEKWKAALEKMVERGFNINSDIVLDALRAAWKQLDLSMIASGEKRLNEPEKPPECGEVV